VVGARGPDLVGSGTVCGPFSGCLAGLALWRRAAPPQGASQGGEGRSRSAVRPGRAAAPAPHAPTPKSACPRTANARQYTRAQHTRARTHARTHACAHTHASCTQSHARPPRPPAPPLLPSPPDRALHQRGGIRRRPPPRVRGGGCASSLFRLLGRAPPAGRDAAPRRLRRIPRPEAPRPAARAASWLGRGRSSPCQP
jgi:hypothetical protein